MRMPRKKKVFRKFIFGDGAKILRYRNSVWLNNQAFLMQYNVAKNLWLKLRYIRYQSGTLKFLFWTWHHHYHHLHHHNHHDDQEKHNTMYKKSRANGSQAGGLPDCTEVTDWPSTRTTFEISLILPSHSHLRKEKPLVFLSFRIVTGTCSHFRNLFSFWHLWNFQLQDLPTHEVLEIPSGQERVRIIPNENHRVLATPRVHVVQKEISIEQCKGQIWKQNS